MLPLTLVGGPFDMRRSAMGSKAVTIEYAARIPSPYPFL